MSSFHRLCSLVCCVQSFACAATVPPPPRLVEALVAEERASELGADQVESSLVTLDLARDEIAQARSAMREGDNVKADGLLGRAIADAELAGALATETKAAGRMKPKSDDRPAPGAKAGPW